jgi:hypothetical protein
MSALKKRVSHSSVNRQEFDMNFLGFIASGLILNCSFDPFSRLLTVLSAGQGMV